MSRKKIKLATIFLSCVLFAAHPVKAKESQQGEKIVFSNLSDFNTKTAEYLHTLPYVEYPRQALIKRDKVSRILCDKIDKLGPKIYSCIEKIQAIKASLKEHPDQSGAIDRSFSILHEFIEYLKELREIPLPELETDLAEVSTDKTAQLASKVLSAAEKLKALQEQPDQDQSSLKSILDQLSQDLEESKEIKEEKKLTPGAVGELIKEFKRIKDDSVSSLEKIPTESLLSMVNSCLSSLQRLSMFEIEGSGDVVAPTSRGSRSESVRSLLLIDFAVKLELFSVNLLKKAQEVVKRLYCQVPYTIESDKISALLLLMAHKGMNLYLTLDRTKAEYILQSLGLNIERAHNLHFMISSCNSKYVTYPLQSIYRSATGEEMEQARILYAELIRREEEEYLGRKRHIEEEYNAKYEALEDQMNKCSSRTEQDAIILAQKDLFGNKRTELLDLSERHKAAIANINERAPLEQLNLPQLVMYIHELTKANELEGLTSFERPYQATFMLFQLLRAQMGLRFNVSMSFEDFKTNIDRLIEELKTATHRNLVRYVRDNMPQNITSTKNVLDFLIDEFSALEVRVEKGIEIQKSEPNFFDLIFENSDLFFARDLYKLTTESIAGINLGKRFKFDPRMVELVKCIVEIKDGLKEMSGKITEPQIASPKMIESKYNMQLAQSRV